MSNLDNFRFVSSNELSKQIGLSTETLKKYRLSGKLKEGIHWVIPPNKYKPISYNLSLIIDWIQNRANPSAHLRAIEAYLSSLPSNQPAKGKRQNNQ